MKSMIYDNIENNAHHVQVNNVMTNLQGFGNEVAERSTSEV